MYDWKVLSFFYGLFRRLLNRLQRYFPEEPVKILIKTGNPQVEKVSDYVIKAFSDYPIGYMTPYQVSLYHPLANDKPRKAMKETLSELEKLFCIGCLKVSKKSWSLRKVMILRQIYQSLEQELTLSVKEGKERFGLLHGHINDEIAHVEDLTDNTNLEETKFFKTRNFTGMSFAVKPCQIIVRNLDTHLSLSKPEVIGTYHTHLIPYRRSPSLKDAALLMANLGKPHLIICGSGIFAYTFKSYRKILLTFPVKSSLEVIWG
ncbi:MAG: hypothetical protein FJ242_09765 [Nitrospira sp.]|nr:hypothetical protein [Nitrospira sp.]